jgi:hypothetical protein
LQNLQILLQRSTVLVHGGLEAGIFCQERLCRGLISRQLAGNCWVLGREMRFLGARSADAAGAEVADGTDGYKRWVKLSVEKQLKYRTIWCAHHFHALLARVFEFWRTG